MSLEHEYTPFRLPANFWRKNRRYVGALVLNGAIRATCVAAVYFSIRRAVDGLQQPGAPITGALLLISLLAVVLLLTRMHERHTAEKMSQNYLNRLRRRLLSRLMRASVRDVNAFPAGGLAARLGGDLSSLRRWLSLGLSRLIVNTILLTTCIGLIASISLTAGAVIMAIFLVLATVSLVLGERLRVIMKSVRSTRIRMQSLLVERLGETAMIRIMGQERREIARVNKLGKSLEKKAAKQGLMLGGLRGLGEAGGIILIVGAFAAFHFALGSFQAADAAAVISLILFMSAPVRELGRVQEYYRGAAISLVKLTELMNMPRIVRGPSRHIHEQSKPGTVEFRKVSCSPAIRNFSASVASGERVAIVGRNGAGKSTLLQLATGLLKPESGSVRLGGVDPRRLSPAARAMILGACGEGFGLLRGGLDYNIAYRRPAASRHKITQSLERFELDQLAGKFRQNPGKRISQGASNVSSGERARISLARATLDSPMILMLDEPESNLDVQGVEILRELLSTWPHTILLITHQPSFIRLCDQVWDMDTGKVRICNENVATLSSVEQRA